MKLHYTLLMITSALLILPSIGSAAIVAEDDFSYTDGALAGKGSGVDLGWAQAWRNTFGSATAVSGGVVNVPNGNRVIRNLDVPIGGASDAGETYQISVDLQFAGHFNGFEARNGGDGDGNRVINLGVDNSVTGNQAMRIGSSIIDFAEQTGVHTYLIEIVFGATGSDQDTAELFIDNVSQGAAVNIGTGFQFDRVGFAAFVSTTTLPHADNLSIEKVIPVPAPAALPAGLMMIGLVAMRRRRK